MKRLVFLLAGPWLAGCSDLGFDVDSLRELEQAQARWERSAIPPNYLYAVERICYCPAESIGPVWVFVARREAQTWTYVEGGMPVPPSLQRLFPTVEGAFAILREAYAGHAYQVRVTFDPHLGYPTEFWIDYDERMADEELGMRVTRIPSRVRLDTFTD